MVEVRPAEPADEDALAALDLATWTWLSSPAPRPEPDSGWTFFDERTTPEDVLVAIVDGEVAGYVKLGRATPLAASDHVRDGERHRRRSRRAGAAASAAR